MISTYDSDYLETKAIMTGQASMKPEFGPLADWVDATYGVKTINVVYDSIEDGNRSRLEICFEFESERSQFYEGVYLDFETDKQKAIAEQFKQTIDEQGLSAQYPSKNMWVIYGAFEPVAREEANSCVTEEEVLQLQQELNNPELWTISRLFAGTTFFLYTDEQLKRYQDSKTAKLWADRYFDLLEKYDTFGYFKRETFSIYLDSKENFDTNYQSNWYYYYK